MEDEVQRYIRWYGPAETHNVPAVRAGIHVSKAALWWEKRNATAKTLHFSHPIKRAIS